jgi:hypothetical protein
MSIYRAREKSFILIIYQVLSLLAAVSSFSSSSDVVFATSESFRVFRDAMLNHELFCQLFRLIAQDTSFRLRRYSPAALAAPPTDDSEYQIDAADVAESLFAMLIAVAKIAVVDVDLEMLPKRAEIDNDKVFSSIAKYDKRLKYRFNGQDMNERREQVKSQYLQRRWVRSFNLCRQKAFEWKLWKKSQLVFFICKKGCWGEDMNPFLCSYEQTKNASKNPQRDVPVLQRK